MKPTPLEEAPTMAEIAGHQDARVFVEKRKKIPRARRLIDALNGPWHKQANQVFLVIILAHWAEHIWQAVQVYFLNWPRAHSHGALGLLFPWLNTSEWLHYGYALIMLAGLVLLRPGFVDRARFWWNLALAIQVWHFFEHGLLLTQALLGVTFFDSPVRTSILQLMIPRVELHLFYNAIVFIPMVIAMVYHFYPPTGEAPAHCNCRRLRRAFQADYS
jgi:hypothetical protein